MRELLYLAGGLVAGGLIGMATMACLSIGTKSDLEHELAVVRASRNYWETVASQWERAYEVEIGMKESIAELGKQVDSAAKEMGL